MRLLWCTLDVDILGDVKITIDKWIEKRIRHVAPTNKVQLLDWHFDLAGARVSIDMAYIASNCYLKRFVDYSHRDK